MCQLTFINTNNAELNRIYTLVSAFENTRKDNQHGWGIFTEKNGVRKTNLLPAASLGFGTYIRQVVSKNPTILHVRSASKGSDIKPEFNHPFETDNLILAHNGTLSPKVDKKEYEGRLDSEVFLSVLDECYLADGNKDLMKSLELAMDKFTGKFAFLIYEKRTKAWYAVRGFSADLRIVYLLDADNDMQQLGYVINTVGDDLATATDLSLEMVDMTGEKHPLYSVSKIEDLETETVYKLGKTGIEVLGKLKQNYAASVVTSNDPPPYSAEWWAKRRGGSADDLPLSEAGRAANTLIEWIRTYGMSLEDLDMIMEFTLGVTILECEKDDIEVLKKYVFPKLQCARTFRTDVTRLLERYGNWWMLDVYKGGPFQYPYMLEKRCKEFLQAMYRVIDEKKLRP